MKHKNSVDTCKAYKQSVLDVLAMELRIPNYQRPYKWTRQNVTELLGDIFHIAFKGDGTEYRVGTVILHRRGREYDIVDGQQRIFTFILLRHALKIGGSCPLIEDDNFRKVSQNKETQLNLNRNYRIVSERVDSLSPAERNLLIRSLENELKFIVMEVERQQEAFQLFDSQNTRGKRLYPHDLLKAYHLREMDDKNQMEQVVVQWEKVENEHRLAIRDLFDLYLHPILCWSNGDKCIPFTERQIAMFKGVSQNSEYAYRRRVVSSMPHYQLSEQFVSGEHFFRMVEHYRKMLNDVMREVEGWGDIGELLLKKDTTIGFKYAKRLFYCALISYFDRFGNFSHRAVLKLFRWAFMVRVDMENLGFDTINKYAIDDTGNSKVGRYTNNIAMFRKIRNARSHHEIEDMYIIVSDKVAAEHGGIDSSQERESERRRNERRDVYNVLIEISSRKGGSAT